MKKGKADLVAKIMNLMAAQSNTIDLNAYSMGLSHMYDALNKSSDIDGIMPRTLTAENGAKALLIGEFHEKYEVDFFNQAGQIESHIVEVPVTWQTIKEIYKTIVNKYGA